MKKQKLNFSIAKATVLALASACATHLYAGSNNSEWTDLLDAELSHWETWTAVPHESIKEFPEGYTLGDNPKKAPAIGLSDPYNIYTTEQNAEGDLILKVSGKVYGGLTSKATYSKYHLSLQVKWGEKKWPPRENKKRDSGILYHCTGPHGALWKIWKRSSELQIMEGDFGDLFLLGGPTAMVTMGEDLVWNPALEAVERKGDVARGIRSVDTESPHGEWTQIDLYVLGDSAIHVINGTVVMAISDMKIKGEPLIAGELQIQSEGAECYYKDIRIRPIDAFPESIAKQCNK
ncbi:MAG: 3-keto-disaccharide hydrolase [Opitutaceae bacterium]